MSTKNFDINRLRVAKPCPVPWDSMSGDDRVRRCDSCQLNIFNIEAMTAAEIERLIREREGRLCIRLYRRTDGTVATSDCPVELRAIRRRVGSVAAAAFAMIFGLVAASFGQKNDGKPVGDSKINITRTLSADETSSLTVTVYDSAGAVIPGVQFVLAQGKVKRKATSNDDGICVFKDVAAGTYDLTTKASGFTKHVIKKIEIKEKEISKIQIELQVKNTNVTVGIYTDEPIILPSMAADAERGTISHRSRGSRLLRKGRQELRRDAAFCHLLESVGVFDQRRFGKGIAEECHACCRDRSRDRIASGVG